MMSEWDTIKRSKAYQVGREEMRAEVEKMISDELLPLKQYLDEVWKQLVTVEAEVQALKAHKEGQHPIWPSKFNYVT